MKRGIFLRLRQGFAGRIILSLLLFIFYGKGVMAEEPVLKSEYSYRHYTIHDGLPEMGCSNLYQDNKGFIWIATISGFARFDGYTFHSYLAGSEEVIYNFYEDTKGNISCVSLQGLYKVIPDMDTLQFSRIAPKLNDILGFFSSLSLPNGYCIYSIDYSNGVYAFTDSGLTKVWEHDMLNKLQESLKPYWDRRGKRFFIPTYEGSYVIGEDGVVKDSFAVNTLNCFIPYKEGFLAVADDGLYEYDNHVLKRILDYPFFTGNLKDYSILEDASGNYIIRSENTIFRYSNGQLEIIASDLPQTHSMLIDREGNLWVATDAGIYNFYGLNFKNHTLREKGNYIISVNVDKQNRTWLASIKGELFLLNNGKTEKISYPASPHQRPFFSPASLIVGDDLFLGGGFGVLHHNMHLGTFDWLDLPKDVYMFIVQLPSGDLAITGNPAITYIYRVGKGVIRKYTASDTQQGMVCSAVDRRGRLLLGGSVGLAILDGDSIQHIFDKKLFKCQNFAVEKSGTLWMTCQNRLVSMKDTLLTVVYTFPNTSIRNLYITNNNIMIINTLDAVYIAKDFENNPRFVRYDQYNGFNLLGNPTYFSMVEDQDGFVWLPTIDGAVKFHPEELLRKQPVPALYVQAIQSSANNITWANVEDGHSNLKHTNNNVRFNSVALCYSSTGNVRYHYRLLGFQNKWSEPTKQREITFNNLPPGNYTFEIYADAGTDESHCETQSFAFYIQPAFWQTAWFFVSCIAFLMLASAGIALYIQRRKNKILLEKLRAEKELNELRISGIRLKAIPHFNANVLAAIEYYIANRTKEEAMHILGIYSDFTYKTLSDVDKAARPLDEELAYVKMYLDLEKIRFIEKFDFKIEVEEGVDKNVQLPNMILHTYCENAVKHGLMPLKSGGLLTIRVSQHKQIVCVCVEDNGVGRDYAAQNRHLHSSKQGLSILNRQIEIYNRFNKDKINQQVEDLEKGTRFTVDVPMDFSYLN